VDPGFGVPSIFQLADAAGVKYEGKNTDSAKKLLTNPDLNTEFARNYLNAMGKKFGGDPVLMAASYNAGPGAVERAGNQVPNFPETKKYVAGISPERFESASQSVREARRAQMGLPPLPAAPAKAQPIPGAAAAIDQVTDITKRGVAESNQQLMMDMLAGRAPIPKRATPDDETLMREKTPPAMMPKPKEEAAPAAPAAKPEEDSDIAALRRSIASRREELGKQKEQDKYMALLAAGLGMMGGTSRYAAQNIGQGALQGVAALQAARKEQRQAEQDVLASELGLSRATLYEKMRQDQLASNKEIAAGKLAVSQQLAALRQQQGYRDAVDMWNNSSARTALEGALKQEYGKNWQKDDKANLRLQAERNRFIQELLRGGSAAGVPSYAQLMG
jgi:soluble lytic murein transglycosylase-like protein